MNAATPHPLAMAAPSVRLPITLCVLAYGPHADLAERFLSSLYHTVHPALFQLRAGLNETEARTQRLFEDCARKFGNVQLFVEPRNRFKSPLMRRMFHQPAVETEWTLWCDDDTHFTKPDWLQRLVLKMVAHPEIDLWGLPYRLWRRDDFIRNWIEKASWYRGLPLKRGKDLDGNDAAEFRFATGGFWAVRTRIIRELDWPDPRLVQANDDFLLGEAMRQNHWRMAEFRYGVKVDDAPRRNAAAAEVCDLQMDGGLQATVS